MYGDHEKHTAGGVVFLNQRDGGPQRLGLEADVTGLSVVADGEEPLLVPASKLPAGGDGQLRGCGRQDSRE